MPYASKSQQKWAFANKMPWAKKWAHETGEHGGTRASKRKYASLPTRVKKKRTTKRRRGQ